jgi:hypothetical protein
MREFKENLKYLIYKYHDNIEPSQLNGYMRRHLKTRVSRKLEGATTNE